VVLNEVSTGAENDLETATTLIRQMVCMYGMGASAGLMHCGHRQELPYPGLPGGGAKEECSDETARQIDDEVKHTLEDAYQQAKALLVAHRDELDRVAEELLRRETLDRQALQKLLGRPVGGGAESAKSPPGVGVS
jgi:cell division protease FtsH